MPLIGVVLIALGSLSVLAAWLYARHLNQQFLGDHDSTLVADDLTETGVRDELVDLLERARHSRQTLEAEEAELVTRLAQLDRLKQYL